VRARYGQKLGRIQKRLHFDALQRLAGDLLSVTDVPVTTGLHVLIECGHERELW